MVVCMALYENEYGKDALWVRPLRMFTEVIEREGKKMPRFKFIEENRES